MVAKSYQNLEQVSDVYICNGKRYVKVRLNNGTIKQVRFYSEQEYRKMYPAEPLPVESSEQTKTQKEVLGFEKGYITIFKGDTYANLEWFKKSIARYARFWGWYIVSTEELPEDLPFNITPIRLDWEAVGTEDGTLKPETLIAQVVEPMLYDAHPSEYQGAIGNRIEIQVTIKRAIELEGSYGPSTMHIMEDENENIYVWTTSSRHLEEGTFHIIKGTVKEHRTYHNCKQTVLTRCIEVK